MEINFNDVFKEKMGSDPESGDFLILDGYVLQLRATRGWVKVCPLVQPGLEDSSALQYEVGDSVLTADMAHLLAFIHETSKYDPRVTLEDYIATIIKVFKGAGWIPTRGSAEKRNGTVLFLTEGRNLEIPTCDALFVLEQLRDSEMNGLIEVPIAPGKFTFVNAAAWSHADVTINDPVEDSLDGDEADDNIGSEPTV
jgi:hypothetical protein